MKRFFLSAVVSLAAAGMSAQQPWSDVAEFSTYTDATNPVKPGGNNLLQGAAFSQWIANDSWTELGGGPYATYSGNNFTTGRIAYTAPQGRGGSQWQAQMMLTTNYQMEPDKKYDLTFHVKSTAANRFTVKVEDVDDPDNRSLVYRYVTLPANREVLFVLHDAVPSVAIPQVKLLFDAGGAEVGSTIEIYDIVLQSADDLSGFDPSAGMLEHAPEGYVMVWNDEFDSSASLTTNWNAMNWNSGHVNNERQNYRPASQAITAADGTTRHTLEVKDGHLLINCFKGQDGKIYSGRIDSHDANGPHSGYAAWRYGYMEARIKLPSGRGTWPAYWMMPEGVNWTDETWPTCGEIDIMEEVGYDPDKCVSSLHAIGHYHGNNTQISSSRHVDNMEGGWVTYAMLWTPDRISMYANGRQVLSYDNDHQGYVNWPYDRPYYLTLNLAWGGDWGGSQGVDENALPVTMEVDYVRVYQLPDPEMKADGSGAAFIHGPYNGVARDGIVPSSTFDSWHDNFITLADSETPKVYTHEFTVGRNLHPDRVDFAFSASADGSADKRFTPSGKTYKATLADNPYLQMSADGHLTLKPGAPLGNRDKLTVTLDCSRGTDRAQVRVNNIEGDPVSRPEGVWIIGSNQSVVPGLIDTNDAGWNELKTLRMTEQSADKFVHTFTLGETLSRKFVNFKFFCQNGFKNADGVETAFVGTNGDYLLSSDSPFLGIGTGSNGHDNGNVYLKVPFPADADKLTVTLDCTRGYDAAVLTTAIESHDGIETLTPDSADTDAPWYDIYGRRIDAPTAPGLYIHGHTKVVIR